MADEDDNTPDLAGELAELREAFQTQQAALETLQKARSPQQKREAEQARTEADTELEAHAKALGLTTAEVQDLKRKKSKDQVRELLAEIRAEEEEAAKKAADDKTDDKTDDDDNKDATVTNLQDAQDKARKGDKVKPPPAVKPDDKPNESPAPSFAKRLFG